MKPKVYLAAISLTMVLGMIITEGCKRDCDPNNPPEGTTENLGPYDKENYFPYKDFDSIRFIKNNSDTIVFIGGKFESGYNRAYDQNPSCAHLDKRQYYKLTFTNQTEGTLTLYEERQSAALSFVPKYSITFNNGTFGPKDAHDIGFYRDSTMVNMRGHEYINVYKFNSNMATPNLFFVSGTGIIRMILNDDTYELLPR